MRAVLLQAPHNVKMTERQVPPPPGPGEAQVRVLRVGVCGTDLHAYTGRQPMIRYPLVPGHELAVEVVAIGATAETSSESATSGSEVHSANVLLPGTLCCVLPYVNCGECVACMRGRTNACLHLEVLGVHSDGGMTELINVPTRLLVPANGLEPSAVALVEMLAIGEHAAARGALKADDTVLVVGTGPIGMGAAAAALRRTEYVALTDLSEERLHFAVERGLGTGVTHAEDMRETVSASLGGLADVVIDATGSAKSMVASAGLLAPGGRLVLVGHTGGELPFDNQTLHRAELTVLASRNATRHDFDAVLASIGPGGTDVDSWITHRVALDEVPEALPDWVEHPSGLVKALVEVA